MLRRSAPARKKRRGTECWPFHPKWIFSTTRVPKAGADSFLIRRFQQGTPYRALSILLHLHAALCMFFFYDWSPLLMTHADIWNARWWRCMMHVIAEDTHTLKVWHPRIFLTLFHLRTPQRTSLVFLSLRFAYFHFVAKFVLAHKDTERKETDDVVVFPHVFPYVLSRPIPLLVGVGVWPCVSLCVLIEEQKMIMNASSCVCKLLGLQKT